MPNKYVYQIKRKVRGRIAPEGRMLYLVYVPYLDIFCVIERMQLHCFSRLNPCTSAYAPFFNGRDERAARGESF